MSAATDDPETATAGDTVSAATDDPETALQGDMMTATVTVTPSATEPDMGTSPAAVTTADEPEEVTSAKIADMLLLPHPMRAADESVMELLPDDTMA